MKMITKYLQHLNYIRKLINHTYMGELLVKTTKLKSVLALSASALLFAACDGLQEEADLEPTLEPADAEIAEDFSIAMVTDEGGVDDQSFNQSAWEGMQEWASVNELPDMNVTYYESNNEADFEPNLQQAVADDFDIAFGIGFLLEGAISDMASQYPDQYFGIVDSVVEADNVVSINFADHEAAFLAGVAAAETTESDVVGFIGGIAGPVIDRFEAGFKAGVAHVNEDIEVLTQYAESFADAGIGQQLAAGMFDNGADVIFHAAGGVGNGVFNEATNRMDTNPDDQIWVIGVDRDQEDLGEYSDGNLTLTSTLKEVGMAIGLATNQTLEEGFPGGENIQYGLEDGGVGLTRGNMSEEAWEAVEAAWQELLDGNIEVPETP